MEEINITILGRIIIGVLFFLYDMASFVIRLAACLVACIVRLFFKCDLLEVTGYIMRANEKRIVLENGVIRKKENMYKSPIHRFFKVGLQKESDDDKI